MRERRALAAALFAVTAWPAPAQPVVLWTRLFVDARLDNDGRARVRETHEVLLRGGVKVLDLPWGLGVEQQAAAAGVVRLDDEAGDAGRPMTLGDAGRADGYELYAWGLRVGLRAESDPEFEQAKRRFRIEYTLRNAVTPAWDLPGGSAPLDLGTVPRSLRERLRETWAAWGEAWPRLDRHYRYDHDVLFPNRRSPSYELRELTYRLEYDTAWRLLDPEREIGRATPDVDYRVQRTLEYLPPGRPSAVDRRGPALRIASWLAPAAIGFALWALFVATERRKRRGVTPGPELFERVFALQPPELLRRLYDSSAPAARFVPFVMRLVQERRLALQVEPPATEDAPSLARLRLLSGRDRLHPYEREFVDELFGSGLEVTSQNIQERHRGKDFEPEELLDAAFERHAVVEKRGGRPLLLALALGLGAAGLAWVIRGMQERPFTDPYVVFVGVVTGLVLNPLVPLASWPLRPAERALLVPWALFAVVGLAAPLIPNTPLAASQAGGLALLLIAGYTFCLARLPRPGAKDVERVVARAWAEAELRRARPALRDAWTPHLEAIGLGRALERWRRRFGGSAPMAAPDLSEQESGAGLHVGPTFTGALPPPPEFDEGWADGFYVWEE